MTFDKESLRTCIGEGHRRGAQYGMRDNCPYHIDGWTEQKALAWMHGQWYGASHIPLDKAIDDWFKGKQGVK